MSPTLISSSKFFGKVFSSCPYVLSLLMSKFINFLHHHINSTFYHLFNFCSINKNCALKSISRTKAPKEPCLNIMLYDGIASRICFRQWTRHIAQVALPLSRLNVSGESAPPKCLFRNKGRACPGPLH